MNYKLPTVLFAFALPFLSLAQINDNCNNAVVFPTLNEGNWTNISSGETIEGANQSLPPIQNCTGYMSSEAKDVWFKFQAISSEHTIKVTPSVFQMPGSIDPIIDIYSSCGSASLVCMDMGGGDGWEEVLTYGNFTVGANYYIRVYHYNPNFANPSSFNDFSIKIYTPNSSGASDISFSPNSLNFGTILVDGGSSKLYLNVTNDGNQLLTINNINSQNSAFGTYPSNLSISPGQTESVEVNFNPSSATTYNSNIEFFSNAPSSPNSISVTGTGTNAPVAQISVTPSSLPFGAVAQNSTAPTMEFNISNTGNSPLSVTAISVPVGYAKSWNMGQILPGAIQLVVLSLQTANIGAFGGGVTINSNATNSASLIVSGSVVQNTNFITGSVKDITGTTPSGSGLVDNTSIGIGKTVELYNSGNQLVESTTTNSAGVFNFMNVPNGTYSILAKTNLISGQSNVKKTGISVGANISLKSPKTLLNKINELSNELAEIKIEIDGIVKQTNGYYIGSFENSFNNYYELTDNYQQASIVLGRLYEVAKLINELSKDANKMSIESTTTIYEVARLVLSASETIQVFKLCILPTISNGIIASGLNWLADEVIGLINLAVDELIELSINLLPSSIKGETKAFFDYLKSATMSLLSGDCSEINDFLLSQDFIKNAVLVNGSAVRLDWYITKTQQSVELLSSECANADATFSATLPYVATQVKNITLNSHTNTDIQAINTQLYRDNAEIAGQVADAFGNASDALGLVGNSSPIASIKLILKASEVIFQSFNAYLLGSAIVKSEKQINDIKQTVWTNTNNLLLSPPIKPVDYYNQEIMQFNSQNLDSINTVFIEFIDSLLEDIDYSRDIKAINKISRYRELNSFLNEAIKANLYPIYAITEQALTDNPNFENLYSSQLLNSVTQSYQLRSSFSSNLIRYIVDTTDLTTSSSVIFFGQTLKNAHLILPITISQFTNLTSQYQAPAFPVIFKLEYPKLMEHGANKVAKIFVGNYGALDADGVFISMKSHGGFTASPDSFYIESLPMNSQDSVEFVINAPLNDTIGGFEIIISDTDANSYGAGLGIRTVEQLPTNTSIEPIRKHSNLKVKVSPNPTNNHLKVNYFLPEKSDLIVSVYDARGGLAHSFSETNKLAGDNNFTLSCKQLVEGLYFLTIRTEKYSSIQKFFVNK